VEVWGVSNKVEVVVGADIRQYLQGMSAVRTEAQKTQSAIASNLSGIAGGFGRMFDGASRQAQVLQPQLSRCSAV